MGHFAGCDLTVPPIITTFAGIGKPKKLHIVNYCCPVKLFY